MISPMCFKKSRKLLRDSLFAAPLLMLFSCAGSGNDTSHLLAAKLFEKTAKAIASYTDSIADAPDSASLHRMTQGINDRLVKIAWEFPADTDLKLSEEENDSLIHMLDRLAALTKEKSRGFELASDSAACVQNDSVSF